MSTSITDRTLSYVSVNTERAGKDEILKYINGVSACGADYIEINSDVLKLLGETDFSEKYIFKIRTVEDIKLSFDYKFAYVSLHIGFLPFFEKISAFNDIIAEMYVDEYTALPYLMALKKHPKLTSISMIRLTGVVSTSSENTTAFVEWFKNNFYIPLDICPLNTMLSGAGDAISFYREGADCITLSFGRNNYYSSLEDFLINLQLLYDKKMPQETITAICATSLNFMRVFECFPCGIERIVVRDNPICPPVYDIEKGLVFRAVKPVQKKKQDTENAIERQIRTIGLEREIEDAIIDMLKATNFGFYQNIIKRNIID